jgi:hypothetical protein
MAKKNVVLKIYDSENKSRRETVKGIDTSSFNFTKLKTRVYNLASGISALAHGI